MVTRQRRMMALLLTPLILLAIVAGVFLFRQDDDATNRDENAEQAITWLRTQQLPEGGFAGFSGDADPGMAADVALAFAAAGINPSDVNAGGADLLEYLNASAAGASADAGLAAKLVLALAAAGADPRAANGTNLVETIESTSDATTGWYGISFYGHLLAVLALDTASIDLPPAAVEAIVAAQTPEGAWGFNGTPDAGTGDSNTTAIAIQALIALDQEDEAVQSGLAYLRSLQAEDGTVAYDASMAPNLVGDANSTALVIQAFLAAGEDPGALAHGDPVAALKTFQNESGAFQYQPAFPDDSLMATAQAVPALLGVALPYDEASQGLPSLAAAVGAAQ